MFLRDTPVVSRYGLIHRPNPQNLRTYQSRAEMHLGRQWKRMAFNKLENPEEMLDSAIFGLRRG
jgi:hypothetical protein